MTIRLFDPEDQRQYQREVETYQERTKACADDPKLPWPSYPKRPEPFADSEEKRGADISFPTVSQMGGSAADLRPAVEPAPRDGTTRSTPEGFESSWTTGRSAAPFKKVK